jgi:hypothetical protein
MCLKQSYAYSENSCRTCSHCPTDMSILHPINMHTSTRAHIHTSMHIYIYIYIYVYIYIYTHTHTHIYIYIYICMVQYVRYVDSSHSSSCHACGSMQSYIDVCVYTYAYSHIGHVCGGWSHTCKQCMPYMATHTWMFTYMCFCTYILIYTQIYLRCRPCMINHANIYTYVRDIHTCT